MPKQSPNPLWDYFKVRDEGCSKAECILCKKLLSRGSKDPHKMTTTNLQNHLKKTHSSVYNKIMQTYSKSEATSSKAQRAMETFCSIQTRLEEEQTDEPESGNLIS